MSNSPYTCNYYFIVAVKDWKLSEAVQKYRELGKDKSLVPVLSSMISDLQKLLSERKPLQKTIKLEIEKIKVSRKKNNIKQMQIDNVIALKGRLI